jgi:5-methylcytosine-specific restriction protein A
LNTKVTEALKGLKPSHKGRIMDLVAAAGIDVSKWALKADGTPVRYPRANPKYCYEWSFGGGDEPILLCVWHESLRVEEPQIVYEGNMRATALQVDRIANEDRDPRVRSRARDQARRASSVDSLLRFVFGARAPIRIAILDGHRRDESALGRDSSRAHFRTLDSTSWFVHAYDDTSGRVRLVRGERPVVGGPTFVDQFSVPEPIEKRQTSAMTYPLSAEARASVLRRAEGICELCGTPGFKTENGAIYLETHHVVSLADGGADEQWNVVALCANDHRRAHFSERGDDIREILLKKLVALHPAAQTALRALVTRANESASGNWRGYVSGNG